VDRTLPAPCPPRNDPGRGRDALKPFNCPICAKRAALENGRFAAV
jgi:hypothetical protein